MKYLAAVLLFFAVSFGAQAQVIDDVDLSKVEGLKYCELVGKTKGLTRKINIFIDYGQENTYFKGEKAIRGANGRKMKFNSMIDALNFMNENGWDYVDKFMVEDGDDKEFRYLMKRR